MRYFLDTNIIIYFVKGKYPAIKYNMQEVPVTSIVIPSIVEAEIETGLRKCENYEKSKEKYAKFLNTFNIANFDHKAARCYGKIRSSLERNGKIIGSNDLLIASIVMAENGTLITHNVKEFSQVNGLKIQDWTDFNA